MRAVRGYCQQAKPNSLRREESVQVYRKAVKIVLDNERKASPAHLHVLCLKLLAAYKIAFFSSLLDASASLTVLSHGRGVAWGNRAS